MATTMKRNVLPTDGSTCEQKIDRPVWEPRSLVPRRVTSGFVEAGGVVPEKFNCIEASSNIDAEYGNQGTDFHLIPREGFGW